MNWEIVGIFASVMIIVSFFPQIYKGWKTRRMDDFSYYFLAFLGTAQVLWLAYGLGIGNTPIIATNAVALCCNGTLVLMKYFYSKKT
ncbi:hypothetical protein JXB11_04740 [Candidatus Woesearchaeota archaeon]|nr:hypothetical protein [Candidatus Woesearchaeota archaeon]